MKKVSFANLLFEDTPPPAEPNQQTVQAQDPSATTQPQNISLDQKVDRFLIQYERESTPNAPQIAARSNKPTPALPEGKRLPSSLVKLLFEADDDKDLDDPTGGAGGGAGADSMGGLTGGDSAGSSGGDDLLGGSDSGSGSGGGTPAPPPVPVPKLNINVFATKMARLVNNYEALLDPRTTILRRAEAYITKNYSPNTAKELMIALELNYGLSIKTLQDQQPGGDYQGPPGVGAGVGDLSSNVASGGTVSSGQ